MKTRLIVSIIAAMAIMSVSVDASAQAADKETRKEVAKHEKLLKQEMRKRAIKEARKEAKRLAKEGFNVPIGQMPMDKQLENSWQAAYEIDENGFPYYIISTQKSVAGNYSAAQMQAMNAAKIDIAGQIQTMVNQVIETKVASNELQKGEAASLNSFVSSSKNIISNSMGRVIKLVEVYRTLKNGNTEVMVTVAYNSDLATTEAIKAIRESLTAESVEVMQQLDKLVTK